MASVPGRLLAAAFHDDPMFVYIEPDPVRRARVLPWFFTAASRLGRRRGRLDVEEGKAAAIWLGPGENDLGLAAIVRSGLWQARPRLGTGAMRRFTAITDAFDEAGRRAHGERYWQLFILGVQPGQQGNGYGGRLIEPVLADADATGEECYLETCSKDNLAFYTRHRFEVAERVDLPDLPTFWTMIRRPS